MGVFLKPNLWKIIVFLIFLVSFVLGYLLQDRYHSLGPFILPFVFLSLPAMLFEYAGFVRFFNTYGLDQFVMLLKALILLVPYYYFLACLIYFISIKVKGLALRK